MWANTRASVSRRTAAAIDGDSLPLDMSLRGACFWTKFNQMLKCLCGRIQDANPTTKDQFQWDSSPFLLEQDPFSPALFNDETTTRDHRVIVSSTEITAKALLFSFQ